MDEHIEPIRQNPASPRRRTPWVLDLLLASVIAGAAPLGRVSAVYDGGRVVVATAAVVTTGGAALAIRSQGARTRRMAYVAAAFSVATVGLIGATPSPNLPSPSPFAVALVAGWMTATAGLAIWVEGGVRLPRIGQYPRSCAVLVAAPCLAAGIVAREMDRVTPALLLTVVAYVVAVCTPKDLRLDLPVVRDVRAWPRALQVAGGAGLLWWAATVRFWAVGVMRSGEVGYRAWFAGYSSLSSGLEAAVAVAGWAASVGGILAVGALVTLNGAGVVRPIVRWLAIATVAGLLAAPITEWMF